MSVLQVIILAVVQGLAELLPVSSSAHVVVVEKLMGLDPSSPPMTLLLVMLHTGTMAAVILYFWQGWRSTYFRSMSAFKEVAGKIILATAFTGLVGEAIIKVIEKTLFRGVKDAQIEDLFGHLDVIAPALALAAVLILLAGLYAERGSMSATKESPALDIRQAGLIGMVQGVCLPFRGFSRSGATISVGIRLVHTKPTDGTGDLLSAFAPSLLGAAFAFLAGLVALKWLSSWLEGGRWYLFGIYCLIAAAVVFALHRGGY